MKAKIFFEKLKVQSLRIIIMKVESKLRKFNNVQRLSALPRKSEEIRETFFEISEIRDEV